MAERDRRATVRVDPDGVRTTSEPGVRIGVWLTVAVLALVALGLLLLRRPAPDTQVEATAPRPDVAAGEAERAARPPSQSGRDTQPRPPVRAGARPVPRPVQAVAPETAEPTDPDAPPEADAASGEQPSGIALFPPPGTDPPKPGIVVPEDFELPPGYVRHYQATDDGQRLPAILMFHPDYEWVDERGQPLAIPEDHVVPPDLAPPGLPIEILQVPANTIQLIEEPPGS